MTPVITEEKGQTMRLAVVGGKLTKNFTLGNYLG